MIKYKLPDNWIKYNPQDIHLNLVEAESAIRAFKAIPYQRSWVEDLQNMELKREVAGTSRIEGADFTDRELDEALKETPEKLFTRSQRQAHAAAQTYRWITQIPDDRPVDGELIREIHRHIVTGADDDHCEPGVLRKADQNVNFGQPRHRGAEGGQECLVSFQGFIDALKREYLNHPPIIRALAAHYHLAAMHSFLDGNGRTARALEALMLQRAGLRDTCFISMSNYYYDEKIDYLKALSESRSVDHDITPFLNFALKGITLQVNRLLGEIRAHVQKALFRNTMYHLFGRLETPRKRVIAERQLKILKLLLETDKQEIRILFRNVVNLYQGLKNPLKAFVRDLNGLYILKAVNIEPNTGIITLRLEWPTEITESDFLEQLKKLPQAKTGKIF
jgi:Fic family protein